MPSSGKRTPIVGGNWKMNTDLASARALAGEIIVAASSDDLTAHCEIALFPPFTYIATIGDVIRGTDIRLGAQDLWHETNGAFTGEISAAMLCDLDVTHVIVGHSERRHVIGEDDALIHKKLQAALNAGLTAIFCIGETLEQREAGQTDEVVLGQLSKGLEGVDGEGRKAIDQGRLIIAYEPVWAIGTGRTASAEDAQKVHKVLRQALAARYNEGLADSIRIQYGGSVKAANAGSLIEQPDVDGFLVGGASLQSDEFLAIIRAACGSSA